MAVTLSEIVEDRAQAGGRRAVRERHVDHLGAVHFVDYLAEAGADANAMLSSRATLIVEQLRQAEINANVAKALNAELTFTFAHSTVAQNRTAIRDLFKTATKWELMTLGWVINELALSDNQLKALFDVNNGELVALKAKLSDIVAKYEAALALVGQ